MGCREEEVGKSSGLLVNMNESGSVTQNKLEEWIGRLEGQMQTGPSRRQT